MKRIPVTYDMMGWVQAQRATQEGRPLMNHERIFNDAFIVLLFNGATPPDRSDWHINTAAEFFVQIEGEMRCRIRWDDGIEDIVVGEGEVLYVPPLVPHLNSRTEGSTGLVLHEQRAPDALDVMVWYCNACDTELHRVSYRYTELKENLQEHIRRFLADEHKRTCPACGEVFPAAQGYL